MTTGTVLLVYEDTWMRRLVASVLEPRGFHVVAATGADDALAQAADLVPSVLIVDIDLQGHDGFALVEALRARSPACARAPVLFLGAPVAGKGVVRHGVDQFVAKPLRLDALVATVEAVVAAGGVPAHSAHPPAEAPATPARATVPQLAQAPPKPTPAPAHPVAGGGSSVALTPVVLVGAGPARGAATQGPAKAIVGTLDKVALSSLLVLLEMERASGVLVLVGGGRTGRVFVRAGRVIAASVDDGALQGKEAVYHLLTWKDGRFEFSTATVDMKDEIEASTEELLLEGARRIDEGTPPASA